MTPVLAVLQVVAPVFVLAAIGVAWVKAGFEYRVEFVTRLSMTLSVPCLIFVALMTSDVNADDLTSTVFATLVAFSGITIVIYGIVKVGGLDVQTYWAPLIFSNTGNLGLPLALFAFGDVGLGHAVIVFAIMAVYSFSAGVWMVSGGGSLRKVVSEPVVWGSVAGGIFLLMGWETPEWITNSMRLIGQMAIPLMLITLGVALARLQATSVVRSVVLSVIKVTVCIALSTAVALWFELAPIPMAVLIVQLSTPVAVTSYLLAQKYGADAEEVASLVVVSTALSVVYLPLILGFVM